MKIVNPTTEEVIKKLSEDNLENIRSKYEKVKDGQYQWAKKTLERRINIIRVFNDLLEEESEELARTLTNEVGKTIQQSRNELKEVRNKIFFFIQNSAKWLADEWIDENNNTTKKITLEPLGVIANISAWNSPYLVGVNVFVPALISGNSVLYKPSEYATLSGLHIQRLLYKAGVPENVFEVIIGRGAAGQALLNLPINGYFFTGSNRTGKYIAQQTAGKFVPVHLELGGRNPLYIMDDVEDMQSLAQAALAGIMHNCGQSCCSVGRIYVHEKIYDKFIEVISEKTRGLKLGDPLDENIDIGPLGRKERITLLEDQVSDAIAKGGKVFIGGNAQEGKGYFFEPTIIGNVDHSMKIMTEESFGPVIGIQKVRNDEEAIALMNDTSYGLTAAVYSKSKERAEKIMQNMDSGTVYWNCYNRMSTPLPWSGRKNSGIGSTFSSIGIRAFVQPKAYHLNEERI